MAAELHDKYITDGYIYSAAERLEDAAAACETHRRNGETRRWRRMEEAGTSARETACGRLMGRMSAAI